MEGLSFALNVIIKGKKIYDILKTFVDTKIQMRAEKED